MYLLLLLVVVGVLTRPTEGSFRRHVLQQVLEDVGEERRRRTREFRRQGLVEGILGGLALRADAALTREALEQAARYRDCLAFSVGAFNLGQGGGMWLVGYANKWWPLPERVCGMLTAAVAGSDWWDVPPTRWRD